MRIPAYIAILLPLFFTPALASDELKARAEANWALGSERSILMTEFWVPLAQDEQSVVYGDYRIMGDDQDNREFNIGLGYREMVSVPVLGEGVAGIHGWFDRRYTERGSHFNQVTAGGEWFGDVWDVKLNTYWPLNDEERFTQSNPNTGNQGFVGNQILVNTDQSVSEEALKGIDFELGWRAAFMDRFTDSTRIYGGVYHFEGDRAESVSGWRTRVAADITSDIEVGTRFQSDDERGSQGFLEATVRFPFGQKKSYRREGLRARLDESPERDIDIVSGEAITDDGVNKPLLNTQSGTAQNVIHVDNTAAGGGDGSFETPFNTLAAAEAAAGANDLIYIHRGDGTAAGQNAGITLNDNGQMLVGAGTNLLFSDGYFSTGGGSGISADIIIEADPAGAPTMTNGGGDGITITADDVLVAGLIVDGTTGEGMDIDDADDLVIRNTSVLNPTDDGIDAFYNNIGGNTTMTVDTVTVDGGAARGMDLQTSNDFVLDLSVLDSVTQNNGSNGLLIVANSTSTMNVDVRRHLSDNDADRSLYFNVNTNSTMNLTLEDSTIQNNVGLGRGIQLQANNDTNLTATLTNNNVLNNVGDGIITFAFADADLVMTATGNSSTNNDRGYFFSLLNDSINTVTLTNNSATGNGSHGLSFGVANDSITTATLTGNTVSGNGGAGFFLNSTHDSILNSTFTSNTVSANTSRGFYINANNDSSQTTVLNNNMSLNGIFRGYQFQSNDTSDVTVTSTNNTSQNDANIAFYVPSFDASVLDITMTGDQVTGGDSGIFLNSFNNSTITSTLSSNTVTGVANDGFHFQALANTTLQASVFGNTSTGNGSDGIFVDDDSSIAINVDLGGGGLGSTGGNRVFGNTAFELHGDLNGNALSAQSNWWGDPTGLPGGELTLSTGGTVDSTNFLTSDPGQ